jgi:hypothetical protein
MMRNTSVRLALPLLLCIAASCTAADERNAESSTGVPRAVGVAADTIAAGAEQDALAAEQEQFWHQLLQYCGHAFDGTLSDATAYYRPGLLGRTLTAHFVSCEPDLLHIALHVDDDRSRNWILTRSGGTLRLKHEHRHEDGSEDAVSQYGGDAPVPGLAHRQIFPADPHTTAILPERADNFWFLELSSDTLFYGVHWPRAGHSVRLAFDLSTTVAPPPAPWGY